MQQLGSYISFKIKILTGKDMLKFIEKERAKEREFYTFKIDKTMVQNVVGQLSNNYNQKYNN